MTEQIGEHRRLQAVPSNPGRVDGMLLIEHPRTFPLGIPVTAEGVKEVWDVFVAPHQDEAQSMEMRRLMAILRSVYRALSSQPDPEPPATELRAA